MEDDNVIFFDGLDGFFEIQKHERGQLDNEKGDFIDYYQTLFHGTGGPSAVFFALQTKEEAPPHTLQQIWDFMNDNDQGMKNAKEFAVSKLNNDDHFRMFYVNLVDHTFIFLGRSSNPKDYDKDDFRYYIGKKHSYGVLYDDDGHKKIIDFSEGPYIEEHSES